MVFMRKEGRGQSSLTEYKREDLVKNCQRHLAENFPGIQCPASSPLRISSLTNFIAYRLKCHRARQYRCAYYGCLQKDCQ